MERLAMCRICLAENVRMHLITDLHLQNTFEKLTNIPFITGDRRPLLACYFCYARLKQCSHFTMKCLMADRMLTQILNVNIEQQILESHREYFGGFMRTPTENINIVDGETDVIPLKEEEAADCDTNEDVFIKEENYPDPTKYIIADLVPVKEELPADCTTEEDYVEINEEDISDHPLTKCTFSRLHFFEVWSSTRGTVAQRHKHVLETMLASLDEVENIDIKSLDSKILNLCTSMHQHWTCANKNKSKFLKKYFDWLNVTECVDLVRSDEQCIQVEGNVPGPSHSRTENDKSHISNRTKRRRLVE